MPALSGWGHGEAFLSSPVLSGALPVPAVAGCACGARRPLSVRLGLRSARRPQVEGRWACSRSCLRGSVESAVRREFRRGTSGDSRLRHRVPLGLILQARGVISGADLRKALELQRSSGARIGEILAHHFGVTENCIATALAAQWNCPVWHLSAPPDAELMRLAPAALFRQSGTVPLRLIGRRLSLASADSVDAPVALALERMHGISVESGIAMSSVLENFWMWLSTSAVKGGADAAGIVSVRELECADEDEAVAEVVRVLEQWQPVESRMVRAGRRLWLRAWLEPAALEAGPCAATDVLDHIFVLSRTRPRQDRAD